MGLGHPPGSVGEKAPGRALSILNSPPLLLQLAFASSKRSYVPLCCTLQHGGGWAASHPTKGFGWSELKNMQNITITFEDFKSNIWNPVEAQAIFTFTLIPLAISPMASFNPDIPCINKHRAINKPRTRKKRELQVLCILHNRSPSKAFSHHSGSISLLLLSVMSILLSDVFFISSLMIKRHGI